MKVKSSENPNKNIVLLFNENKNPMHNMTKTRNDAKHYFMANDYEEFLKNKESRTKPKIFNCPKLNIDQNSDTLFNQEKNNLESLFHKLSNGVFPNFNNDSNPGKNGQNINIIVYSPNYIINNEKENNSCPMNSKTDRNISLKNNNFEENNRMNFFEPEKKSEKDIQLKKNKCLFDSQFNLIEENLEKNEINDLLIQFDKMDLNKYFKESTDRNKKNEKKYTNTGNSVNCYNINEKRENMENPYLKDFCK